MKEQFFAFLKKNRVYRKYFKYFDDDKTTFFELNDPKTYITRAFIWIDTEEKWGFWNAIDLKWTEIVSATESTDKGDD